MSGFSDLVETNPFAWTNRSELELFEQTRLASNGHAVTLLLAELSGNGSDGADPKTVRRERPPDNPEIRKEMKATAAKRHRFGYRRIGVMLERKRMIMNHKKLYRLYSDEKLGVRRRRGRMRALVPELPVRRVRDFASVPHFGGKR